LYSGILDLLWTSRRHVVCLEATGSAVTFDYSESTYTVTPTFAISSVSGLTDATSIGSERSEM